LVQVNQPSSIDRQVGDLISSVLELFAGIQDSMVLDGRSNNVITGADNAKDSEIVGLRAPACEDDLSSPASEQAGNRLPGRFHGGPRMLSVMMNRRSVTELLEIKRAHRFQHLWEDGCGGVAVQVNAPHFHIVVVSALRFPEGTSRTV
jgi:hypothetical protein